VTGPEPGTAATASPIPIARLLAMAYRSMMDDLHQRLRDQGWDDVRPAFGFVLLAARDQPTTAKDLAALMGTTKQAASQLIDVMVASGYVRRSVGTSDARRRDIVLSARGRKLLVAVEAIYAAIEAEWATVIGARAVDRLRGDLTRVVVDRNDGELPAVRPTW
jgi:DNA-binding MarR family transcriptional regulator